ncbi:MAG: hypothetical protein IAE94_09305 [Chthoniobacterales bacterium]|nr:hypothetical protein [Chthoniobacterales bacterium]
MRIFLRLFAVLILLFPLAAFAWGKKPAPVSLRLFCEGNEKEGESFVTPIELTNPPKKVFMRKVPIVTERDIRAFYPFPGRDGMIGAYFLLDPHGADKLEQFTTEDRGKLAVVVVNGRVAAALQVEQRVQDGILYVPGGLLPNEIEMLEAKYPVIGREKEFGKKPPKEKKK